MALFSAKNTKFMIKRSGRKSSLYKELHGKDSNFIRDRMIQKGVLEPSGIHFTNEGIDLVMEHLTNGYNAL